MKEKKAILIIDDEMINRRILSRALEGDYVIYEAGNGQEALTLLRDRRYAAAAIILDLVMPVMNGYEFLEVCNSCDELRKLPVIVSTSDTNADNEKRCLKLGACDFISKPYNIDVVRLRLKNAIDRSQLELLSQLQYVVDYDALTGIFNKSRLYKAAAGMLMDKAPGSYVFIVFDIDNFKAYNSFFGVNEGNHLLQFIAQCLTEDYGDIDEVLFSRCEADIFNIIMPNDRERINRTIQRIIETLLTYKPEYHIKPSFGVYVIVDPGIDGQLMNDRAKMAAKVCKGRYNQYVSYYDEQMSQRIDTEQRISNEMETALLEEQFVVYYQPKYSLANNRPAGAEALVRWMHPERGMISPGEFIPVFEKNGFISKLDYYMWEHVCMQLRRWIDEGISPQPVSVNVSRVNIYNPQLVETLCGLLKKYDIPVELFNLELTESAYTDDQKLIKQLMDELQSRGFCIFMDDFGSGYSSLNVLKDIPVDVLKIDMKFLYDTNNPGRGENILASVVRMAKWLAMPVIAEGVEKESQVEFLRSIGCEYVQGFYFARPMPAAMYEALQRNEKIGDMQYFGKAMQTMNNEYNDELPLETMYINTPQACGIYEYENGEAELIRANDAYYNLFGFKSMDNIQQNALHRLPIQWRQPVLTAILSVLETHETSQCEFQVHLSVENPKWIQAFIKYIRSMGERHIAIVTFIDITEQKRLEIELQKFKQVIQEDDDHQLKMLVVDDVEMDRVMLENIFEEEFQVLGAADGLEAVEIIKQHEYGIDIIILDLVMPHMGGMEFLNYKEQDHRMSPIPVVIVTADNSEEQQALYLEKGVSDYVTKPFVYEAVKKRIRNVLEAHKHFKSIMKEYNNAMYMAQTDGMTHLYNRAAFESRVSAEINGNFYKCAMIMVDIDNFKGINDAYGHDVGDEVVISVARTLKGFFRRDDIVGRLGGDELSVFVSGITSDRRIYSKGCELCMAVNKLRFSRNDVRISCSVGIAVTGGRVNNFERLYKLADNALYEAKENGKNRCVVYSGTDELKAENHMRWVNKEWLFDQIEEAIMLLDIEGHDILYANRAALKLRKIEEAYEGKKCYEVIADMKAVCNDCPNEKLMLHGYTTRLFKNPEDGRRYLMKDKIVDWNGRKARLQMVLEIDDEHRIEMI